MRDYDQIGTNWVPYLMQTVRPSQTLPSLSTDTRGLRNTVGRTGEYVSPGSLSNLPETSSIGIVVGGSTVFGVGSTHDKFTIPSSLNRLTQTTWLNLGGRAFNSTQELIQLMLLLPRRLDRIVVFSGANNLVLTFLSQTSAVYNSLYSQSVFEQAMSNSVEGHIGVRKAANRLLKELCHRLRHAEKIAINPAAGNSYDDMLECYSRDLRVLKALADGLRVPLHFALQPVATWLDKSLAAQEKEMFNILDSMNDNAYQTIGKQMAAFRDSYFSVLEQICRDLAIGFYNVNCAPEFMDDEWLFVDRVHLTDRGCEVAARVLKREFGL